METLSLYICTHIYCSPIPDSQQHKKDLCCAKGLSRGVPNTWEILPVSEEHMLFSTMGEVMGRGWGEEPPPPLPTR